MRRAGWIPTQRENPLVLRRMRRLFLPLALALSIVGCDTTPSQPPGPVVTNIYQLPTAEIVVDTAIIFDAPPPAWLDLQLTQAGAVMEDSTRYVLRDIATAEKRKAVESSLNYGATLVSVKSR